MDLTACNFLSFSKIKLVLKGARFESVKKKMVEELKKLTETDLLEAFAQGKIRLQWL